LSNLCKEGALFDPLGKLAPVATIAQVVVSIILCNKFKTVAEASTEQENHRTQTNYENSLIIKRFFYMFCDYFLYLLYIGLYELRIDILRKYLGTLFTVDEIRRLMSEAIVPSIKMWRA
jgi:anoctamin-10